MERNAICNIPVESTFPGGTDSLPMVRANIASQFSQEIEGFDYPLVFTAFMISSAPFTVTFNDETKMDATQFGERYIVDYNGPIGEITFEEDTTLTAFQCEWGAVSGAMTATSGSGSGGISIADAVLVVPQILSDEQKKTARENIGAVDAEYVDNKLGAGTYVFNQATASNVWRINHNLNKYPSVTVVDSAGTAVVGEINYPDKNNVVITFTADFSGSAYLN